jgi:hypothetical protein
VEDEDTPGVMLYLLALDLQSQAFHETCHGPRRFDKRIGPDYDPGTFIGNTEDHPPATLIGEGGTVLHELFELVVLAGLFELEVLPLRFREPVCQSSL